MQNEATSFDGKPDRIGKHRPHQLLLQLYLLTGAVILAGISWVLYDFFSKWVL